MHFCISSPNPTTHFFEVSCTINNVSTETLDIQLPAWRPGRYELQHFAKNIQRFEVFNTQNEPLAFHKITKDRWRIEVGTNTSIVVRYVYYANVLDAGGSYVAGDFWYINPVNLCVYADEKLNEPCSLSLQIPENYQVACGLAKANENEYMLLAKDYYELVDSPILASNTLQSGRYEVAGTIFHVWFQGNISPDWPQIMADFKAFTSVQIATMGEFPEPEYHFLNLILPTAFYHGVEHRHSTMVVLGPDDDNVYPDLLGVSSHELFHAWNIIRIRPKELLPYDFTKENYFTTCFIAEGVTTYYGDLFLRRANVFDDDAYFLELETYLKRHFSEARYAAQSLAEASFDLWLDGYTKGIPQRKVSVYQKGALVALILDLTIRQLHNHKKSIDDVMRLLWQRFGKPFVGYTIEDYQQIVEEVAGVSLDWYWQECVFGNEPLDHRLNEILADVGLKCIVLDDNMARLEQINEIKGIINRKKWLENSN